MYLYNSATHKKAEFLTHTPGRVEMYTCGPTVYHFAHIGNLRSYIMEDVLEKALRYEGYDVNRVMNITDVGHLSSDADTGEDKMVKGAKREHKTVMEIAQYYTGKMILADRKKLKTPNGMILGTPGSGKSFSAKRSIVGVFLNTKDDILICDPEAEYFPLVNRLEGQVIKISPTSTQYVNPMDINLNYSEDDNPLALKSDFILSFCELAAGGRNGLEPVEKTVIDRAVRIVYRPYIADPRPENMPLLEDLYDEIKRQPEPEAQRIAAALELYVHGSLNVFNHRTNVDINNRIVCFDIKELGKQLKSLGMLVIQDQVWNRVSQNRDQGKSTWYFVDEFHLLLRGEVGSWSVEIWKRFRKWGGIPTGITQNIKDLLSSPEIENIFENSDFVYLLNQASGDRKILCERLNISNQQAAHISNAGPGEGLIFFGNVILPFVDDFPKDNELYSIMTTKLGETGKGENEHE